MTDREAFVEIQIDLQEAVRLIHQHRGEMPVDDLMDMVQWRLEGITGIVPDDA
jgi:hypothetical protein